MTTFRMWSISEGNKGRNTMTQMPALRHSETHHFWQLLGWPLLVMVSTVVGAVLYRIFN